MIKEAIKKYPKFSETDFIRLYCAMNFKNELSPIIKHHELEKRLYEFYSLPEFRELFQDICPKEDYINPENSYLDLQTALQMVQLLGLLTPIHDAGEIRSMITCDESIAQRIISNTDAEMVDKMANLFNTMYSLNDSSKEKDNTKISNAESVMNHFMEKLDHDDFTYDKEQSNGTELAFDEGFIDNQVKSYKKLLKSPSFNDLMRKL